MKSTLRKQFLFLAFLFFIAAALSAQPSAKRTLTIDDFALFQNVTSPQCSPDGNWIAYTVSDSDVSADKRRSAIWMVNWEGTQNVHLTYSGSDNSPRWSPDGKYLAFLSTRPAESKTQVWLIDRRGGEAHALTDVKGDIYDYEWSPDGTKLVLVMTESTDSDSDKPKPIVIDRYHFKADEIGYLTDASRTHLYLFDIKTKKLEALTTDTRYEDIDPVWSPDGSKIAYVSDQAKDPDRTYTNDIFIIDARAGAKPVKLITADAPNYQHLVWSPDGRWIAYLLGSGTKNYAYIQDQLAVIPSTGGAPRVLTDKLDLMISAPEFSADSSYLTFLVADDRVQYPAKVALSGGSVERLLTGKLSVTDQCRGENHTAMILGTDSSAPEIYALEGTHERKLTSQNDSLLSKLHLGAVEDFGFHSADGTEIHGMIVKPPNFQTGKKYPTILWIHGGPNMQDDHSLPVELYAPQLERQLFAANGYVVLSVNYRGSSGRGSEFSRSIFADWGNKEVSDLLAGVDEAVRMGIADPKRLGIGGWSYGGILTDATIARDQRFKAAMSGAGCSNMLTMYGVDEYVMQYDQEIGPAWGPLEPWTKISYAFFHADRIKTPTLFMGGEKDFNVPIAGSEQMYQALRTLGVPTQMIVYPGQFHIFTRPSFIRDRLERWLAWFHQYLK